MIDLALFTSTSTRAVDAAGSGSGVDGSDRGGRGRARGASPAEAAVELEDLLGRPEAGLLEPEKAPPPREGPLGPVESLLDALVVALRSVGGELLEERLGMVGRCEARLAAVKTDTVAELARRDGEAQAAETVREWLRRPRGGAKRDVRLAGQLTELPDTAEALADGIITPRHTQMIADAANEGDVNEVELIAAAERQPTDIFGRTLRDHLNRRTAGEDLQERRRRQRAKREASITRQPDGMYKLFGLFDPVAGARAELPAGEADPGPHSGTRPPQRAALAGAGERPPPGLVGARGIRCVRGVRGVRDDRGPLGCAA